MKLPVVAIVLLLAIVVICVAMPQVPAQLNRFFLPLAPTTDKPAPGRSNPPAGRAG